MLLNLKLSLRFLVNKSSGSFSSFASWLAIGGLAIGIAALMLTASIVQGFEEVISQKLENLDGQGRVQHVLGYPINIKDNSIDSIIHEYPKNISGFIRGACMLRYGSMAEGVLIEGIENSTNLNNGEIIIGKGLISLLKIDIGDVVYLQSFSSNDSTTRFPIIKSFKVIDTFYSGLKEYDNTIAYVTIQDSRKLFNIKENFVSGFIINNMNDTSVLRKLKYPYYFETWKEKHSLLFEWISFQRWPAYIMFGLIALVGLVNLVAALTMIIVEKTYQIGILLSQGMTKNNLVIVFLMQGGFIGLIGGVLGGFISILVLIIQLEYGLFKIPSDIYFMDKIPFAFDFIIFGLLLLLSFFLSVLASYIPVRSILKFQPSTALRYE